MGSPASAAQSTKPPASKGPDSGTRIRLANGPASETRPKTPIHSGHRATEIATLIINNVADIRTIFGQLAGTARSATLPAQMIAAQAPTLMIALGDNADFGSQKRRTAAAKVSAADAVVSRPRARAPSAAASITQARTQGGSDPVIKV